MLVGSDCPVSRPSGFSGEQRLISAARSSLLRLGRVKVSCDAREELRNELRAIDAEWKPRIELRNELRAIDGRFELWNKLRAIDAEWKPRIELRNELRAIDDEWKPRIKAQQELIGAAKALLGATSTCEGLGILNAGGISTNTAELIEVVADVCTVLSTAEPAMPSTELVASVVTTANLAVPGAALHS
ncbi:hypothetical protein [Anaplasma centrale]|nr:hypothetical protein [Anaplasma centrale]